MNGPRPTASATASPTSSAPTGPATPTSASPSPAAATRRPTSCSTWPPSPSTAPGTKVTWLLRRPDAARLVGGGANDELPERGRLGTAVDQLVANGVIAVEHGFRADSVTTVEDGVMIGDGDRQIGPFDEIIVTTGLRPDLGAAARAALGPRRDRRSTPGVGAAHRPQRAQLRHRPTARVHGALPSRAGVLHRRHEELRAGPDVPVAHRLRTGPLRRRRPRRRPRRGQPGRARAARDRRLLARQPAARPLASRPWRRPVAADDVDQPRSRPRPGDHRDGVVGDPLLRLPGAAAGDGTRPRLEPHHADRRLHRRRHRLRTRRPPGRTAPGPPPGPIA